MRRRLRTDGKPEPTATILQPGASLFTSAAAGSGSSAGSGGGSGSADAAAAATAATAATARVIELEVRSIERGQVFGEIGVLRAKPRSATVTASLPSEVLGFSRIGTRRQAARPALSHLCLPSPSGQRVLCYCCCVLMPVMVSLSLAPSPPLAVAQS